MLAPWLVHLFARGESLLEAPPPSHCDRAALVVLATEFERHFLNIAGPPLPFDADAASRAAVALADACWALVTPDGEARSPELTEPRSAAAHLSGDVTLRFLPAIHVRTKLRGSDDPLAVVTEAILRRWPLAGALADIPAPPTSPLTFGDHPGLQLLYAERLVRLPRRAWIPADGLARERVELVFARRNKPLPATVEESA